MAVIRPESSNLYSVSAFCASTLLKTRPFRSKYSTLRASCSGSTSFARKFRSVILVFRSNEYVSPDPSARLCSTSRPFRSRVSTTHSGSSPLKCDYDRLTSVPLETAFQSVLTTSFCAVSSESLSASCRYSRPHPSKYVVRTSDSTR